jgi:serine/threonine protein kinase
MDQLRLSGPARPGDVLGGRYQLEELIGEGGMGSVWRATDRTLERTVAVKVFWVRTADETDAGRRESEKRLLAAVSHPSLVTLYDAHLSDDDVSFLVMEHIDGGTLSSLIARGAIAPRDAASLATDLGEALHVVHEAGIVHRDVKPANILLRPPLTPEHTFRAVLADFGIAHVVDATRVTTPGVAMGTAAYISPEQVRGHAPTPASDIYSLGLVLLEALSGSRAFSAQTPIEAISVRLTAAPAVPGDWGYGWKSLLTAMTALDAEARPTAREVAERARQLDAAPADPASTMPIDLAGTALLLPAGVTLDEPTAALTGLMRSASDGVADEPPVVLSRRAARAQAIVETRRRRRNGQIVGALGLTAAAGMIAVTALFGSTAASPTPAPLPQLEETVDSSSGGGSSRSVEPLPPAEPLP